MNQVAMPLRIENLKKSYGAVEAVKGVSFEVRPGEIFGLLGPNGAGKTSIISILTTLEKPTSGRALIFETDVVQDPMTTKRHMGVVHQEVINSGFFSVEEILEFQSGYYGIAKNGERIRYLLNKLGLYEHREKKVKQLSGGMKRRLMIAKALVHKPKLLLLDEPTAGVDITLRESLWQFVLELQREGLSILLTTHYLEEAEQLCQRVGIINLGRLECVEPTRDVIHKFTQKKVVLQLKNPRTFASPYLQHAENNHFTFRVPMEKGLGDLLNELKVGSAEIDDVRIVEGTLEEAFVAVLNK